MSGRTADGVRDAVFMRAGDGGVRIADLERTDAAGCRGVEGLGFACRGSRETSSMRMD